MDAEGITGAVREAAPELKHCYEGWLAVEPELGGRVEVAFVIVPDDGVGRIDEAHVAGTTVGHAVFEACVVSVMSDLVFDAPDERVDVTYPLVFRTAPR